MKQALWRTSMYQIWSLQLSVSSMPGTKTVNALYKNENNACAAHKQAEAAAIHCLKLRKQYDLNVGGRLSTLASFMEQERVKTNATELQKANQSLYFIYPLIR